MKEVVLYGCGRYYRILKDDMKRGELDGEFRVIGVSDKNLPDGEMLDGWPLIPREKLPEHSFDSVYIMTPAYEREIREELLALGVPARAFEESVRSRYWDRSLSGISIFSNNCWGGYAAFTLGIECCSPTKNLWLADHEFVQLMENLDYYLSLDPVPAGWEEAQTHSDEQIYPLLKIGDLTVHCNHDRTAEEAIEKWQRRKRKVDFNNMLAVFTTDLPEMEKAFHRIDGLKNKYCLVPWESEYPRSIRIPVKAGQTWRESAVATGNLRMGLDLGAMMRNEDNVIVEEDLYREY